MTREEWMRLYDEISAVVCGRKDVLELTTETILNGLDFNLLRKDRNGNTVVSKKGHRLYFNRR